PRPPVLPTSMPERPRSSSIRSRAWLRSISARSITWAGTRLSASSISLRVPVTSTVSRSVAAASARALPVNASEGRNRTAATAAGRERCIRVSIARTPAYAQGFGSREEKGRAAGIHAGIAAATPSASQPVDFAAGLRTRARGIDASAVAPSHAWAQWRMRRPDALTVAGAVPGWPRRMSRRRRHRLPVSALGRTSAGHLEAGALYGTQGWGGGCGWGAPLGTVGGWRL